MSPLEGHSLPVGTQWGILALALLALAALIGVERYRAHDAVTAQERERLTKQAQVIDLNLSGRLQMTSNALDAIRTDLPRLLAQPADPTLINQRLQALVVSMIGVRTFIVVDAAGEVIASNRGELLGKNFRESDRYQTISRGTDPHTLYLSAPFTTPLGVWAMSAGKMIADAQGRFNGYVLAILDPDYFSVLFNSVLYAPDMRAALIHGDGKVVFRAPDPEGMTGANLTDNPHSLLPRHLAGGQHGSVFMGPAAVPGGGRLVVFRSIAPESSPADKLLVAAVSRELAALFITWRQELLVRAALFAVIALVAVFGLIAYQRRRQAYERLLAAREGERRAAEEGLRRREERLRLALDGARMGTWHWDIAKNKIRWSDTYRSLVGLLPDAAPSHDRWLATLHPEDRADADRAVRRALEERGDFAAEYRVCWPDGSVHWIAAMGRCFSGADGAPQRMEGVAWDVSVRKQAEQDLRESERRLRELSADLEHQVEVRTAEARAANAAKSAFLAHMSHEIRTPLNAVLGLTQVLEQGPITPDQRTMLAQIRLAGRSLLGILNDILDLSKIEAGQLQIEERPFALHPVLAQIESMLGVTAHGKGLTLRIAPPAVLDGHLVGDPLRLDQVLTNLIGNAIKFTDQGEVGVRIEPVDLTDEGARLRFEVSDTGIGIAPEHLSRLFTPFTQADAGITRRFGGTGLGLSICKHLIELMGGVIGVESRVGAGSTFWFELPFGRVPGAASAPLPVPADAAPAGRRLAGRHLLVVDDNRLNLEVVARMLALEGARATLAEDGRQALERLRRQPQAFDAVLMDVQMPVLDGLAATRAIRDELGLTDLPVIAVTARVLRDEQQGAHDAGVTDLLPKPVEFEQLVAVLTRWLGPGAAAETPCRPVGLVARASTGDLPAIPGITPERVALLAQGDGDYFLRLLRGFVADATGIGELVRSDLVQGATDTAAERLHRLRGAAANLGALDLAQDARQLEDAIRADPAAVTDPLARFATGLAALLSAASPWLAKPPPPQVPANGAEVPDAAKFAALRAALLAQRPRPARRLFAELAPGLISRYGAGAVQTMTEAMDQLRFDEVLRALADRD